MQTEAPFHPPCSHVFVDSTLNALGQAVQSLQATVQTLVDSNSALETQVRSLSEANTQLVAKLNSISAPCPPQAAKQTTGSELRSTKRDILIGDSMIRNVKSISKSLEVKAFGGAKTGDLVKIMADMPDNSYGDVIIHVGTNDCSTRYPIDKIVNNFNLLITHGKRVSSTGHITISEICPRADDLKANDKIIELGPLIKVLCADSGCVYAENKNTFLHYDGSTNVSLLSAVDLLHLSEIGVKYLLKKPRSRELR